ncbi:hypothetical protein EJB05_33775, partial [Eragrostis curvula]
MSLCTIAICPDETCAFVSTTKQLVGHIAGSHSWPCHHMVFIVDDRPSASRMASNFLVWTTWSTKKASPPPVHWQVLVPTERVLASRLACHLRVCIHPHHILDGQGQPSKAIKCALTYSRYFDEPIFHHYLWSDLKVECTDLSDGLPNREMCFKFIVPNSALGDKDKEAIHVKVSITIC